MKIYFTYYVQLGKCVANLRGGENVVFSTALSAVLSAVLLLLPGGWQLVSLLAVDSWYLSWQLTVDTSLSLLCWPAGWDPLASFPFCSNLPLQSLAPSLAVSGFSHREPLAPGLGGEAGGWHCAV